MPAAARQPPHPSWIELSATLDFTLAALVDNGAAWSVATLPAIKVNSYPLPTRFWPAPTRSSNDADHFRSWHKADVTAPLVNVRC
jgi:hypothetical protein